MQNFENPSTLDEKTTRNGAEGGGRVDKRMVEIGRMLGGGDEPGGGKATASERGGTVTGNPSSGGLLDAGSAHLSPNRTYPQQQDAANLQQNTQITLRVTIQRLAW